jgi:hypothetical protein
MNRCVAKTRLLLRLLAFASVLAAALALVSCETASPVPVPNRAGPNDTVYLQKLLDARDETIIIPAGKRPWQTDPLFFSVSGKTLVFAEGCVVEAREGSYADPGDCLLTVYDSENVVITGYGAALRMRGDDYREAPYEKGQWRHGISINTCKNVRIEGLTIEGTGGDAVYIGQREKQYVCENITLSDLTLRKNHRQGVSVIAVKGFVMEGCTVSGTRGNLPMSGIDFEPNSGAYGLTGCVIRDCNFHDNKGAGIQLYLVKLNATHPPVDLVVENTRSRGNRFSVLINGITNGISGTVTFRDCSLSLLKQVTMNDVFKVRFE